MKRVPSNQKMARWLGWDALVCPREAAAAGRRSKLRSKIRRKLRDPEDDSFSDEVRARLRDSTEAQLRAWAVELGVL